MTDTYASFSMELRQENPEGQPGVGNIITIGGQHFSGGQPVINLDTYASFSMEPPQQNPEGQPGVGNIIAIGGQHFMGGQPVINGQFDSNYALSQLEQASRNTYDADMVYGSLNPMPNQNVGLPPFTSPAQYQIESQLHTNGHSLPMRQQVPPPASDHKTTAGRGASYAGVRKRRASPRQRVRPATVADPNTKDESVQGTTDEEIAAARAEEKIAKRKRQNREASVHRLPTACVAYR
jgi:hypothetical protein